MAALFTNSLAVQLCWDGKNKTKIKIKDSKIPAVIIDNDDL